MKLQEINIRDPFILPHEGKYYLYGTRVSASSKEHCWGKQDGFDVYISEDLENWSEPKSIFECTPDFWGTDDAWAPEAYWYNGKFYLFASFISKTRHRGTHVLVCDTPDGTFIPTSPNPITPEDWECLDGTLYVDKAGTPYMVFCHAWTQIGDGTICAVELSKDLSAPIGEPKLLWKASGYKDVAGKRGGPNYVTDGPFLYRNGDDLLCIWSSFNAQGYVELISKSDNGDIDGNWTVLDTPLSAEDGGHGMIFKSFDGKEYFIMHRPNSCTNERPVFFELKHDEDKIFI